MIIGIDARFYHCFNAFGRFSRNLIQALSQVDTDLEFVCFVQPQTSALPTLPKIRWQPVAVPWYSWQEQLQFPQLIHQQKLQAMHFLHMNVPFFAPQPYVVTIHDLILKHFSTSRGGLKGLAYPLKKLAYDFNLQRLMGRAEKIIAVSEFTQDELEHFFPWAKEKIVTIAPGLDARYLQADAEKGEGEYFLYVGNCYPHKDIGTLLQAYRCYRQQGGQRELHLVTPNDYFTHQYQNLTSPGVIWQHALSDQALHHAYQQAYCLIYPSRYEGFGLPLLEALASGLPIICSQIPPFSALAGDLARYYLPGHIDQLTALLLESATSSPGWRQRSLELTQGYSWQQTAEKLINIYESLGN